MNENINFNNEPEPKKGRLAFVDPAKDPKEYVKRYLNEVKYREWFEKNYPDYTIFEAVGISKDEYDSIKSELEEPKESSQPEIKIKESEETESVESLMRIESQNSSDQAVQSILDTIDEASQSRTYSFNEFIDDRILVSKDAFGSKEMKIKVIEVSDEHPPVQWRFGNRVKVNKVLITIKHLMNQQVEEGEFDIEAIERELQEKRHYTSTNRWIPTNEIKNGYIVGSRHTSIISDAVALDYIIF